MTEEIADPLQYPNGFPFVFAQLGNGNNLSGKQCLPTELGEFLARPFRSLCILVFSSSEQRTRRRQVLLDFLFRFSLSVFAFIFACLLKCPDR